MKNLYFVNNLSKYQVFWGQVGNYEANLNNPETIHNIHSNNQ